ncbi:hypothetical protein [Halobacteroides halobius]|uniref:hypothetical protein n=1 Tax=Halobacteroides halobius TaxID=42422 RepID=UPI000304622C|nr:hypothetical protein [Halobacteroides halobius]
MANDITYQQEAKDYNEGLILGFVKNVKRKIDLTKILIWGIMLFNVLFIILVGASLFLKSSVSDIVAVVQNVNVLDAVRITISSIFCSAIMTMIIGVPFAYVMAQKQGKVYRIINMLLNLPLVMPPAVAGLALLMTFGRRGAYRSVITVMGLDIPFSFAALIIVQVFVMLPLFIQSLRSGF